MRQIARSGIVLVPDLDVFRRTRSYRIEATTSDHGGTHRTGLTMKMIIELAALVLLVSGCQVETPLPSETDNHSGTPIEAAMTVEGASIATFAGGCFWCMEKPFEVLPGVSAVISGYTDGQKLNPTYKEVCSGSTGHTEAIEIHYDAAQISYEDLLQVLWRQIDPTDTDGQYVDRGNQYRPGIYFHGEAQRLAAEKSKRELGESKRFDKAIVAEIKPATKFYPAEEYHQDYYIKSPDHYLRYRTGSGRDRFIDRVWGKDRKYVPKGGSGAKLKQTAAWKSFKKPSKDALRKQLNAMQYKVTQEDGTEGAFSGELWDNKAKGLYVDVVSGEPLFSSSDKFKSGTGWPSFTRPVQEAALQFDTDQKLGYTRDEVRSALGDSHLGHVFEDGPQPTGLRYCINSAALRFVPKEKMAAEGYAEFLTKVE
ncbi:MAG: peptide methionine sulfoxide reductase msrA/msrB [Planctomycetota bacterium]